MKPRKPSLFSNPKHEESTISDDIWAGMIAELEPLKKAERPTPDEMLARLKIGARVALKEGWIINREDLSRPATIGTVTEILSWPRAIKPPCDILPGEDEQGTFRVQIKSGNWYTNQYYIDSIISGPE